MTSQRQATLLEQFRGIDAVVNMLFVGLADWTDCDKPGSVPADRHNYPPYSSTRKSKRQKKSGTAHAVRLMPIAIEPPRRGIDGFVLPWQWQRWAVSLKTIDNVLPAITVPWGIKYLDPLFRRRCMSVGCQGPEGPAWTATTYDTGLRMLGLLIEKARQTDTGTVSLTVYDWCDPVTYPPNDPIIFAINQAIEFCEALSLADVSIERDMPLITEAGKAVTCLSKSRTGAWTLSLHPKLLTTLAAFVEDASVLDFVA
jgi:hypothetical protein